MALRVRMKEFTRYGETIPGGWEARIPHVEFNEGELGQYIRYYMQTHSVHEGVAHDRVIHAFRAIWVRGWLQCLQISMARAASKYRKMFPELGLDGFDPERVHRTYVPGRSTKRKQPLEVMLLEMGSAERARRANVDQEG